MPGGLRGWACAACAGALLACAPAGPQEPVGVLDLERRIEVQLERARELESRLVPSAASPGTASPRLEAGPLRRYTSLAIRFEPLPRGSRAAVRRMAAETLLAAGARSLVLRGDGERSYPPRGPFPGVPPALLYAVSGAAQASLAGSELDVLVPLDGGGAWRVTVWNEPDGRVLVAGLPAQEPAAPASADVVYRPASDDGWAPAERASLSRALSLLTAGEREAIGELRYERRARAPRGVEGQHACGDFRFEDLERAIRIYDCAFENDGRHFVGSLERPERPSTLAILHELGHALALAETAAIAAEAFAQRERVVQAERELRWLGRRARGADLRRVERMRARMAVLSRRFEELGRRLQEEAALPAPVAAFERVPGAETGITPYGSTAPMEAFAEAFALHRADREALARVAPAVVHFFDDGRHLAASASAAVDAPPRAACDGVCAGPDAPVW